MHILWYAMPSILLLSGSAGALVVLEEPYMRIAILALSSIAQWLYLINIYFLLHKSKNYQIRSFWHITMTASVLSFVWFSLTLYGLIYYVEYKLTLLIVPFCALSALLICQQLRANDMSIRKYWRVCALNVLCIAESAFAIHWLPIAYVPKAFFLTTPFFLSQYLSYSFLRKELTVKSTISSIAITFCVLVLVVLTSHWR